MRISLSPYRWPKLLLASTRNFFAFTLSRQKYSHIFGINWSFPIIFQNLPRCAFLFHHCLPLPRLQQHLASQPFVVTLLTQVDRVGFSITTEANCQNLRALSLHRLSHRNVGPTSVGSSFTVVHLVLVEDLFLHLLRKPFPTLIHLFLNHSSRFFFISSVSSSKELLGSSFLQWTILSLSSSILRLATHVLAPITQVLFCISSACKELRSVLLCFQNS